MSEDRTAQARQTILDRWNYSGQPSVAVFNHAVDVANANWRRANKLADQVAALITERDTLLKAAKYIRDRFATDERQGFRSRDRQHRCSGCGHCWPGGAVAPNEWTGAELCGDCWRRVQSVLRVSPMMSEDRTARQIVDC